jgi:hypothetical protein
MSRYSCCFCGGSTEGASDADYIRISVQFPAADSRTIQWFGGHASCFDIASAPGHTVERMVDGDIVDGGESRPRVIAIPVYEPARGYDAPVEGGHIDVQTTGAEIAISGDRAGWRDLARWCLALSDPAAPAHSLVRLTPGIVPLTGRSAPVVFARASPQDFTDTNQP